MQSKLLRTLVGMGIALGSTGCFGQAASDGSPVDDGDAEPATTGDGEGEGDDEAEPDPGDEPDLITDGPPDPLLDAFCDVPWPPTKGTQDLPVPRCIDPMNECADASLPFRCFALVAENTCDFTQERMDPLYCVDGLWECPPGSTTGWECEGDECRNTCSGPPSIPEAAGGAPSSE